MGWRARGLMERKVGSQRQSDIKRCKGRQWRGGRVRENKEGFE